ncbi:putative 4-coumarate--CoA ligase 2 isoform X3 [Amblyomma americanum]
MRAGGSGTTLNQAAMPGLPITASPRDAPPLSRIRRSSSAEKLKPRIENNVLYSPHPKVTVPVCSVYTAVKSFLSAAGSKLAAVDYTRSYSRQELLRAIERYAAGFQSLGLRPGHHVCVCLRNSVDSFVVVFALVFAGTTVVLCNTSLKQLELRARMTDSDCTHVVTDPPNAEKLHTACNEVNIPEKSRFVLGEAAGFISILGFDLLDEADFREVAVADPRNALAGISYSSGITGLVKGMEITHYSFVANMVQNKNVMASDESDVFLAWNPITHTCGFLFTMLAACVGSTCVIVSPALTYNQFIDVCSKYQFVSPMTGKAVGPKEHGEVFFRTPSMMRGYYKQPKETALIIDANGWCRTGDLAYYDETGRVHFVERLKEMIKCMDNQVAPAEIEELITSSCPGVDKVGVVGLPHPDYGEVATAFVALKPGCHVTEKDIKKIVADNLAAYKQLLGGVYFLPALPHNDTGELLRSALRTDPNYRSGTSSMAAVAPSAPGWRYASQLDPSGVSSGATAFGGLGEQQVRGEHIARA